MNAAQARTKAATSVSTKEPQLAAKIDAAIDAAATEGLFSCRYAVADQFHEKLMTRLIAKGYTVYTPTSGQIDISWEVGPAP